MKKFAFYCMPNIGILDAWLPVLIKLKSENVNTKIVFIAPNDRVLEDLVQNQFLFQEAKKLFDGFICQIYKGQWLGSSVFSDVLKLIKPLYIKKIERVFLFLEKKNFHLVVKIFNYFRLFLLVRNGLKIQSIHCLKTQFFALFYDVVFSIDNFPMYLRNIPRYSLSHGIYTSPKPQENNAWVDWTKKFKKSISKNEIIFSTSKNESLVLSKYINNKSIYQTNIPKHDKFWINYVLKNNIKEEFFGGRKYVILISKTGGNERLTSQKKLEFILAIKRVIMEELRLPVLVKLHPTERSNQLYERIFGIKNYNSTWAIMSGHPYQNLDNCFFAISLMSNVCLDLLAVKIPIIELSNIQGMSKEQLFAYFGQDADQNSRGYFRDSNFVLGADSEADLRFQSIKVIKNRKVLKNYQYNVYKKYFSRQRNNLDYIVDKIIMNQKKFYNKAH